MVNERLSTSTWIVSYEIGDMSDSKEFTSRNEAQDFYDALTEQAYQHESDGGSDTVVTMEEVDE